MAAISPTSAEHETQKEHEEHEGGRTSIEQEALRTLSLPRFIY